MNYERVKSSNIAAIGYDEENQVLGVQFLDGSEYEYDGVPAQEHRSLMAAASHGTYLNAHVKGRYPYRKVR